MPNSLLLAVSLLSTLKAILKFVSDNVRFELAATKLLLLFTVLHGLFMLVRRRRAIELVKLKLVASMSQHIIEASSSSAFS